MGKKLLVMLLGITLIAAACTSEEDSSSGTSDSEETDTTQVDVGPNDENSGEEDPRPAEEVEKPTPGPAFGVSEAENEALISEVSEGDVPAEFADVDFLNFTHVIEEFESLSVTVEDGEYYNEDERVYFSVSDVQYGDLGFGEGPEAAVYVFYNTGGTGQFTNVLVYGSEDGEIVQKASAGTGDRAFGGIDSGRIEDGKLILNRYIGDAACCPTGVQVLSHESNSDGTDFVSSQVGDAIALVSFDDANLKELKFFPGTSFAFLSGSGDSEALDFAARGGQTVVLNNIENGLGAVEVLLIDTDGQTVLGTASADSELEFELPEDGTYLLKPSTLEQTYEDLSPYFSARIAIN